jgi:mono/diheme cytochrome c family protein
MTRRILLPTLASAALLAAACGKAPAPAGGTSSSTAAAPAGSDLTPWQLEHGVGPITEPVALGPVDKKLAHEGEELFGERCSSCHKADVRYVGPALGGVTERRTPEFVMNMILDPADMIARHPVTKQLYATHLVAMPNQGLTQEQAREVLEYLRTLPAPPAQ